MSTGSPSDLLAALETIEKREDESSPLKGRRRCRRFKVRGGACLEPVLYGGESSTQHVLLRDITPLGVGFVSQTPLELDSNWMLCLLKHDHFIGRQAMVLRHCDAVDGVYLVGGQFCAETGLLCLLDIDPRAVNFDDHSAGAFDSTS